MPISKKKKENSQPPLRNEGVKTGVPCEVCVNRPALAGRLGSALRELFPYLEFVGRHMEFVFTDEVVAKKNSFHAGITKTGRKYQYRSNDAKASQSALQWSAMEQSRKQKGRPAMGLVLVYAVFRKKRGDCIGLMETVLDSLEGVAYKNDRQVCASVESWDAQVLLPGETAQVLVFSVEIKKSL